MNGRRWSDLSADVLRQISSRLWDAADFIYFHAVCKPWRNSRDPPLRKATQFLPWLLAPAEKESAHLNFRCIFYKASYRAMPASPVPRRNWVGSADSTAVWNLTIRNLRPSLHDPLTGEVTDLSLFPCDLGQWEKDENLHGVVYRDGSTFLYTILRIVPSFASSASNMVKFKAALLTPSGTEWMVVERTFEVVGYGSELYAAYHGGNIMVTVDKRFWHVIRLDSRSFVVDDVLVPKPLCPTPWWHYNYLLESRGELLWVLLELKTHYDDRWRVYHKFYLSVHALEEEESAQKKTMRWVRKDGKSLADRVLFLGWPNSFAVDASWLGAQDGACAYFAHSGRVDIPRDQVGVYRFNLVSNKAWFIDRLPREWNDGRSTWIIPQPATTPIQELIERRRIARETKQQFTTPITSPTHITPIPILRYDGPSFRALVRDLPLTVTSSQLQLFLSKHGQVSSAEVLYYKKSKRSQGIALLTMSTIHANVDDALEALNDLFLHGYRLNVVLVKGERQRLRISSTEAAHQHR